MQLFAEFQRYNVFRRPDWRWQRVLQMCDRQPSPGRCSRRDDAWVKGARNFLLRWRGARYERLRTELFAELPGLWYAYEIYERASEEPEPQAYLEARLLARQSDKEIAHALCTMPEAIQWYEALFFNVADRLENRDWITKQVLMPAILRNHGLGAPPTGSSSIFSGGVIAKPFLDATLKLFAYFGGTHLVDIMITGFQSGKPLASPDDLGNWFDANWASAIRRRSHQASLTFEVNKFNVMELFAIHTKIMEIEKSDDSQEKQRTTIERHIRAMITDLPWAVGDAGESRFAGTEVGKFDAMAAELRDDELLNVAVGDVPGGLEAEMAPMQLPPPRRKTKKKPTPTPDAD